MLSIQTNVNSMNAQENLRITSDFQARTIARLTSGYRINQSGDDAAGLAVANKFRSDVAELTQGIRNANDGLSTMQIIDGGLSNITKMLDRLKTLATQSASSAFEGDRATLDREFQALTTEIDRQASNIGLGSAAGTANRYNKNLSIYVGGSEGASNSGIQVDLSAATDRVTAAQLGLTGQTILGGDGTAFTGTNTANVTANQTFNFVVEGTTVTANITGGANVTLSDAVKQLNDQIGSYGVRGSIVNGELTLFSDKGYTVDVTAGAGGLITTGNQFKTNADVNQFYMDTANLTNLGSNATAGVNHQAFTVSFSDGTTKTLSFTDDKSYASMYTTLSTQLKDNGITVLKDQAGTGFYFTSKSKSTFSVSFVEDVEGASAAQTNASGYTAAQVSTNTHNAEAALSAVSDAVAKLGIVQGKIGTAQNKLGYAIELAQSQITSYSAAESRIRDADIASEAANLTKAQVLSQASMAALAQANSAPQSVLALLRG